jgi:transglutaminase-like putative cysteine protease
MLLRVGFELIYQFPQPTPVILVVDLHYSRASDIVSHEFLRTDPAVPVSGYRDGFGNWCSRILAPEGRISITSGAVVRVADSPEPVFPDAWQQTVETLPEETLVFLLGSRYCETDLMSSLAWDLFGAVAPGYARVQAICDYVHGHIQFDYLAARATRTAAEAYRERIGVCRDFAHLAITFCRCLNIPARYCTGYLSDLGMPLPWSAGDFAAWFEVYLAGQWYTFDPRNNQPRMGRVLMARGRDAADVAIATTFGPNVLEKFLVWADAA